MKNNIFKVNEGNTLFEVNIPPYMTRVLMNMMVFAIPFCLASILVSNDRAKLIGVLCLIFYAAKK